MAVREFQDIDLKQASKLAKLTWGDFYAKGSTKQTIHAGIQEAGRRNDAGREIELQRNLS